MRVYNKIILFCVIFSLCCTCLLTSAVAIDYTVYNSSISETYQEYFKRILTKTEFNTEYVCFRESNNRYYLFYGDTLELHNNQFVSNSAIKGFVIDTVNYSGSSFNTYQSIEFIEIDNLTVNVDDKIVYSSLGNYPTLYESGEIFEQMQVFILVGIIVFAIIWFILRKCLCF